LIIGTEYVLWAGRREGREGEEEGGMEREGREGGTELLYTISMISSLQSIKYKTNIEG